MTTRPHPDPTNGRWCREPLFADIAWHLTFAFGTWMHSVMKLNGFEEDLKPRNASPDSWAQVRPVTPTPL